MIKDYKQFNESKSKDLEISTEKFTIYKNKNEFKLFVDDILVSSCGFEIEKPDKWFDEKYVILHDMKTIEKFQGKGFGKYILNKIFNYVKDELELNIITLIVYKDNETAINLYFKCGFEIFMEYDDSYSLIKKL